MSSWPENPKYIGKRTNRTDAEEKVTGRAKYTYDMQPTGWLYGRILGSKWPAAEITDVDLSAAKRIPGVRAVILVQPLPRTVRFYGQEIAAVAANTREACEDALRAIKVTARPLPFVVDPAKSLEPGAPPVFEGEPNTSRAATHENGNAEEALQNAAAVAEVKLSTQVEVHHPLETHGNTIDWSGDELTCWSSTQGISSVKNDLSRALEVPNNQVRVISEFMGGGFGAKFGAGVEGPLCARLSKEAGAPVKLMLTRFQNHHQVGNRPCTYQHIRIGANADGKLVGYINEAFGSAGYASGGSTAGGGGGAGFPAPYAYRVENRRTSQVGVAINAGSARAFRAPGHPPACFGMETAMDALADKLGMDPVELRKINDTNQIRSEQWDIAAERFGWKQKYAKPGSSPGPVKRGVGCAGGQWGGGGRGTTAEVEIGRDGSVEVRCGTQDLGTATKTSITVVAAETLGLTPQQIRPRVGDTRYPPSGGSGGSSTSPSVCPAIKIACENALEALKQKSGMDDVSGSNWQKACQKLGPNPLVVQGSWQEGLSGQGTTDVQMAEVEVDIETGYIKVKHITLVQDCGLLVNLQTAESQANGGVIMGIGYALYEERVMDPLSGVSLNPNFETYKLPALADMPTIDLVLQNYPERGVIGIGEPVTIPTAAAIANAVSNAIGVRMTSLPITPAKVLDALNNVPPPEESYPWDRVVALAGKGMHLKFDETESLA